MSVAKTVEITAESPTSFEDAVRAGITRASQTIKNIRSAWVQDQNVKVEGDQITAFSVRMKVTFVLED